MVKLQRLGTPLLAQIGLMSYGDELAMFDAQVANGRHYALRTRWLRRLFVTDRRRGPNICIEIGLELLLSGHVPGARRRAHQDDRARKTLCRELLGEHSTH
jgi:hypothetical protein